jgi:hypothetical protein
LANCRVGWVDIGTVTKVLVRFVVSLSKVRLQEKFTLSLADICIRKRPVATIVFKYWQLLVENPLYTRKTEYCPYLYCVWGKKTTPPPHIFARHPRAWFLFCFSIQAFDIFSFSLVRIYRQPTGYAINYPFLLFILLLLNHRVDAGEWFSFKIPFLPPARVQ